VRKAIVIWLSAVLLFGVACSDDSGSNDQTSSDGNCDTSVQESESGLKIQDVECGDGQEAEQGDLLAVHYTGKLEDGITFGSSVGGEPIAFQLGVGMVIQGWDEGFEGMKEGGKRKLTIPPELGYGQSGMSPDIPPNATLIYDVELVRVKKPNS
jgi:FKBP-type peptidyl-prolyl cis-trans isomerase